LTPPGIPLGLIDRLMLGYLGVVIVIAATRLDHRPWAAWVIGANLLLIALVYLVHRPGLGRFGRTLREIYPIVLLPALYGSLDLLNGPGVRTWDAVVQGWEAAIFGGQVSRTWWQSSPSAFWSVTLHAVYFAYYFIVPFPIVVFLWRGEIGRARTAAAIVVATFLAHYLCFLLLPVAGPYYEFPRPTGEFVDNWAARLVYAILSGGSSYGAAFPSSHVAATFAASIATWLGDRRLGMLLLIPTLLMTVGVVYCQMHYAVDALAGLLVAIPISWGFARWGNDEGPAGAGPSPATRTAALTARR
jgi:membrane-associated phospholipid phosphatase